MMHAGLEQEARSVFSQRHRNALNTVGYRELFDWFKGEISKERAIELIKRNTRRYARKQLTWFRNDASVTWFQPEETSKIIAYLNQKIN